MVISGYIKCKKPLSMANKSIGSVMIREIIRMKDNGLSHSQISKSLGKSRTTILKYLAAFELSGLKNKELLALCSEDLYNLFETQNTIIPRDKDLVHNNLYAFFPYVDKELKRVGVSRFILWQEYRQKYPQGIKYSRFCYHYSRWNKKTQGYMPTEYKAGEKLFIDYAGKKLHVIDPQTGEIKAVEVFVGTLGASQYTYVEASFTQQVPDFLNSIQNCLHFFGGVPACIVPDNLKSAVTKADKYEPFINEQFAGFASHYDTSILPARPFKPKDKSLVEGAVNISYTRIYAALRNKEFFSLLALNQAIKELLRDYNATPFQKKAHSRLDLFQEIEKQALKPLPLDKYELKLYKIATVQKNCHVFYTPDKNYYSAPFAFIGKKVKLIMSQNTVEIYHNQSRIALHVRSQKPYAYLTIKEHMPLSHTYNTDWSPDYFVSWAARIGSSAEECIEIILQRKNYPEQNYKSCMGILSLSVKTGKERLNNACKRALIYEAVNYTQIKNILEKGLDKQLEEVVPVETIVISHENIRGSEYFA
jgi:transposase